MAWRTLALNISPSFSLRRVLCRSFAARSDGGEFSSFPKGGGEDDEGNNNDDVDDEYASGQYDKYSSLGPVLRLLDRTKFGEPVSIPKPEEDDIDDDEFYDLSSGIDIPNDHDYDNGTGWFHPSNWDPNYRYRKLGEIEVPRIPPSGEDPNPKDAKVAILLKSLADLTETIRSQLGKSNEVVEGKSLPDFAPKNRAKQVLGNIEPAHIERAIENNDQWDKDDEPNEKMPSVIDDQWDMDDEQNEKMPSVISDKGSDKPRKICY